MATLFLFCFAYYCFAGIAMVIGYHRCLSHNAFQLKLWFKRSIILLGLPAGTPIQWVGNHRFHHLHTDKEHDPHSPVQRGFWYAHNGWYYTIDNAWFSFFFALAGPIRMLVDAFLRPITNQQYDYLAKDIAHDPFFKWVSKPAIFTTIVLLHVLIPFLVVYYGWGLIGVAALWITLVVIYNLGDGTDSIAHLLGAHPYTSGHHAKNSQLFALVTFGDGWHADHHEFPESAKLGLVDKGIDPGWWIILILQKFGIASQIRRVSAQRIMDKMITSKK